MTSSTPVAHADAVLPVSVLVSTAAHNAHVQQMVRAIAESGALERYLTGGVDHFRSRFGRLARRAIAVAAARLDRALSRRAVRELPNDAIEAHWPWELARLAAARAGAARLEDWCWERGELALDAAAARRLARTDAGAFLGVEHGALASLAAARSLGKIGCVAFLSPHRQTRARWVDREYDARPELRAPGRASVDALADRRDRRRDEELRAAEWVITNSSFTTQSLVDAGYDPARMLTVPLGGPTPIGAGDLPAAPYLPMRFVYVGPVSVRKGAHYLLRAWRRVASRGAELHFYGRLLLPPAIVQEARSAPGGDRIFVHGSVPAADLPSVYRRATVLVFPTLCDGFGLVVSEALANGLPVLTTANAGAADAIIEGVNGFLMAPADAEAIASRLAWCLDHGDDLVAMRRAAIVSAASRTWPVYRRDFRAALAPAFAASLQRMRHGR